MAFDNNIGSFIKQQLQNLGLTDSITLQIIVALIIIGLSFLVGWIVYHIFEHYFTKWASKTKTTLDDEIIKNIKKPIYFFVILVGFFLGVDQLLFLKDNLFNGVTLYFITTQIFVVAEIILVAFIITRIINVILAWYSEKSVKKGRTESSNKILNVFRKFLQGIVYLIAFLAILHAFHVDLSGVVVGVGVGGIAIAFALQNILSDVFSAFSIYFNKPFEVGDFITIGQHSGTVTKINLQSTRIQLLQGEEMVVSNREITSGSVRNFRKMTKRRVEFIVRISSKTPLNTLKEVPKIIEKAMKEIESAQFDMVHLNEIGPFSYNYSIIYYINTGDYNTYLDVHEKVNLSIKEAFDKKGIEIGFQVSKSK